MKHHSRSHQNLHAFAVSAHQTIAEYKKQEDRRNEEIRLDYQRQLEEKGADDWLRCLSVSGIVFREQTGNNQKTEKFLSRLAEVLQQTKDDGIATADLVAELEKTTGIELAVAE